MWIALSFNRHIVGGKSCLQVMAGVVYASSEASKETGQEWLQKALDALLTSYREDTSEILWSLSYNESGDDMTVASPSTEPVLWRNEDDKALVFPNVLADLAFDDRVLYHVKKAWEAISGESEGFMQFQDREAYDDNDDEGD